MPNRWPIASGNWSDAAIWSGSIIPTASDDVFTNNRIVNIDVDATIRSIRNSATGSAIASAAQANCFYLNNGVTLTTTVAGAGVIGAVVNASYFPSLIVSGSSSAKLIGDVTVINGNTTCAIILIDNASLSITGSVNGGIVGSPGTTSRPIWATSTGILNISGTLSAGINTDGSGTVYITNSTRVNINGNLIGPTSIGGAALRNDSIGIVTITGSVVGSSTRARSTLLNGSIGTIIVSGSVQAGNIAIAAISSTTNGTIAVYGPISSSIAAPGVESTGTGATNLFTGPFYNTGSFNAVYAYRMQIIEPASTTWRFDTETAGVSKTLYTSNQLPGVPQQSDVRKGTQYNFGLTGSLEMPDPTTVKVGVPTDNTTGSAIFTPQDMFEVLTQDIVTTGSIGETLKNASSVQTVGATISAFKV